MAKKKLQASTNVPKYRKEIKDIYKQPNFDEYHKKLSEDKVKKMVEDKKTKIIEIHGAPQTDVYEKLNSNNMKSNLTYDYQEKIKGYLKNEVELQKKVIEAEKVEPVLNVPKVDSFANYHQKIPEVAIPKK